MACAPRPPPRPPPAPVSVPTSRPFSVTIKLKTSPTNPPPPPASQCFSPAMTRAKPANLSDSVPASLDRAACVVCARSGARLSTAAIATAHGMVLVRIVLIDISCSRLRAAQGGHAVAGDPQRRMRRPRPWHYFVERALLHVTVDREHRGFPAEHRLDSLVVEPRVSADDRQHSAASHAQRQRLCDLRGADRARR